MVDDVQGNIIIAAPLQTESGGLATLPDFVIFTIESLAGVGGHPEIWLATYTSGAQTASFRIELDPPYATEENSVPPLEFGEGRFRGMDESDATAMIVALAEALEAKHVPDRQSRVATLPFIYTSFGKRFSLAPRGGFQTFPAGDWAVLKLFLGEETEEDEGQVFLAINPVSSQAQFVIKDADYGDIVLRHLATVL